jgi:hypothetical protein
VQVERHGLRRGFPPRHRRIGEPAVERSGHEVGQADAARSRQKPRKLAVEGFLHGGAAEAFNLLRLVEQ